MEQKNNDLCPELAALYTEYYDAKEIANGLEDIQCVLVDYAQLNEASVKELSNRYYLLKILRDFFYKQSKKQ